MDNLENLINKKSLLDRIRLFCASAFFCIVALLVVTFLCVLLFQKHVCTFFELSLLVVLSAYYVISLYQRYRFARNHPDMYLTSVNDGQKIKRIFFLILIVISLALHRNNPSLLWLSSMVCVCIAIIIVSKTYPKEYDEFHKSLASINRIELIAALIAFFQLVLAYPQLKNSYNSASSDDISKLINVIKEEKNSFDRLKLVTVPDSLMTEEVKVAMSFRDEIYYKLMALYNVVSEIEDADASHLYNQIKEIPLGVLDSAIYTDINLKMKLGIINSEDSTIVYGMAKCKIVVEFLQNYTSIISKYYLSVNSSTIEAAEYYNRTYNVDSKILEDHVNLLTLKLITAKLNNDKINLTNRYGKMLNALERLDEIANEYVITRSKTLRKEFSKAIDELSKDFVEVYVVTFSNSPMFFKSANEFINGLNAIIIHEAYGIDY